MSWKVSHLFFRLRAWFVSTTKILKQFFLRFRSNSLSRRELLRFHLSFKRNLRKFSQESKVFLAIRRNRNLVTMALFFTVLLVPLSSSVNIVGQLGFINKKLPVETLEGGIILNVNVTDGHLV